jgi:uncharacterized protein
MMQPPAKSYLRRLAPDGEKRLLSLDGGGIRGLITIEILARLEELLRAELRAGPDFVLGDYFDYVAGTSTGAIIATAISLGFSVEEIRSFYLSGTRAMLRRASIFKQFYYRNVDTAIIARLREVLRRPDGDERTLGDTDLRTLLLLVIRNATTNSPWPLSNNPDAKYNDRSHPGCNLDLPLWKIVRASTAAPTYFPPQDLTVGPEEFLFVDGAVSVYNNPAFKLFIMATIPEYRLGWHTGEDKMLLVSIGTGMIGGATPQLRASQMTLLYNARSVPSALLDAALHDQDLLCRALGRCRFGAKIDSEVGTMVPREDDTSRFGRLASEPRKFTYVRYNPELSAKGLKDLGLARIRPQDVQPLDSTAHLKELTEIGQAYADKFVDLAHFAPFPLGTAR